MAKNEPIYKTELKSTFVENKHGVQGSKGGG